MTIYNKPPLGIKPKWLCDELRLNEIKEGINRYLSTSCPIPIEWIKEYNEIVRMLYCSVRKETE